MQWPKGKDDVRSQRSPNTAEAPRQLSLKNRPIVEFLVETPDELYYDNRRGSRPEVKAFLEKTELLRLQSNKNRV